MSLKFFSDKKFHILFWLGYWFLQSLLMSKGESLDFYLIKNIVIVGLQFLVVYINLKWLFPFFFQKGKYIIYVLLSCFTIYVAFTLSFVLIDGVFNLYYTNFKSHGSLLISFDFWIILSGSSFYSLALVCSSVYQLLKNNKEKDAINYDLKSRLEKSKDDVVIIKEGHKVHKITTKDVYFIKGLKEYVIWHTKSKNIIALQTLNSIETDCKEFGFLRAHRSYIVNMNNVDSVESNTLKIHENSIPIGRTYKKKVITFFSNKS